MEEGIINLWNVKIFNKKGEKLFTVEIVGKDKSTVENSPFYKRRALRAAGVDPNLEKWEEEKFTFKAQLLQNMDNNL